MKMMQFQHESIQVLYDLLTLRVAHLDKMEERDTLDCIHIHTTRPHHGLYNPNLIPNSEGFFGLVGNDATFEYAPAVECRLKL